MLDPVLVKCAAERYLAGEIVRDIAYSLGIPEPTLRAAIKRLGVSRPHAGHGPKRKLTPEQERDIAERYLRGNTTVDEISVLLGVPRTTVQRTLKRAGIGTRADLAKLYLTEDQRRLAIAECLDGYTVSEVSARYGVVDNTIFRMLRRLDIWLPVGRPRSCTLNENAFDVITPESARWIGFLIADGCLPHDPSKGQQAISVSLGAKDRCHLELLRVFLGSTHAIYAGMNKARFIGNSVKQTPATGYVHYKVRSNRLSDALAARGMIKNKGPERMPSVELENTPAFWAGMIDGDGWLGTSKDGRPFLGLCGHMPPLVKFREFLVRRRIAEPTISPTDSGIWRIQISGETALNAIALLYDKSSEGAGLKRKIIRARQILNGDRTVSYEEQVDVIFEEDKE